MLPADEQRISLKTACEDPRLARDGRPVHISSVYRWYLNGAKSSSGVKKKLEVEQGPRGVATSKEAIGRFLAALNGGNDNDAAGAAVRTTPPKRPSGSKALAAAGCDAIGL